MHVSRIEVPVPAEGWPFTIPCVAQIVSEGLAFAKPLTIFVGENGSGKSTIVEAIAEAYGIKGKGGRAGRKQYASQQPVSPLGQRLRLEYTTTGARAAARDRLKRNSYFLRAETAFGFMDFITDQEVPGYWDRNVMEQSHGEGFLTVFEAMFREPGLYLMDEPEAALSFTSCLRLVALMDRLARSGAQIVCATHSPILAATPDADIIELDDNGFHHSRWHDLALTDHWRRFLANPDSYLRHIVNPPHNEPESD